MPVSANLKESRRPAVLMALLVLVLLSLAATLLFKSTKEPEVVSDLPSIGQAVVVYEQGAVVSFGEEATIRFVAGEGYWEDTLRFQRLDSLDQSSLTDTLTIAYDIGFDSGRQPAQPVQLTLSCEEWIEERTENQSSSFSIRDRNRETGVWEDVPCRYDPEEQVLVCYLHHFSPVEVKKTPPSPHPLMTVGAANTAFLDSIRHSDKDLAGRILQTRGLTENPASIRDAILEGIRTFNEAFDRVSVTTAALENLFGVSGLDRFNAIAGNIGLLGATIRYTLEITNPAVTDRDAKASLCQTLVYYAAGAWAWQGLQIANIGVFMINYSLNRLATEAFEGRSSYWWMKYQDYNRNRNPHRMTQQGWNDFMLQTILRSGELGHEAVQNALDQKVDQYLSAFFDDDFENVGRYWFSSGPCPDDLRPLLIAGEREELFPIIEIATSHVEDRVRYYQERDMLAQLNMAAELLNSRQQIRVHVYGDSLGDPRVRNLPISIRTRTQADQNLWQGVTDEAGQWSMDLTRYGNQYYEPERVVLTFDGEVYSQPLTVNSEGDFADVRFYLDNLEASDEYGTLLVASEPAGASISIDGNLTDRTTEAELDKIEPGSHQVLITLDGYRDFEATVSVEANETSTLNAVLEESDRRTWSGNGHSYEAICRPGGVSWDAARSEASSMGGYLATINSQEENDFVFGLISDDLEFWVVDEAENTQGPFLGGFQESSRTDPSEGWQWVTGEDWTFANWSPGEPNDAGETVGTEDSEEGTLQYFRPGNAEGEPIPGPTWNDVQNDNVRGYIVEWNPDTSD